MPTKINSDTTNRIKNNGVKPYLIVLTTKRIKLANDPNASTTNAIAIKIYSPLDFVLLELHIYANSSKNSFIVLPPILLQN